VCSPTTCMPRHELKFHRNSRRQLDSTGCGRPLCSAPLTHSRAGVTATHTKLPIKCDHPKGEPYSLQCDHPKGEPYSLQCDHPKGEPYSVQCDHPKGEPYSVQCDHPKGEPYSVQCDHPKGESYSVQCDHPKGEPYSVQCDHPKGEPYSVQCDHPKGEPYSVECYVTTGLCSIQCIHGYERLHDHCTTKIREFINISYFFSA
jgi:hypothetical protein